MNVTIIRSGKVTLSQAANGENQVKVEVGGSGGRLQRHTTAQPYSLETNGAIVESFGPGGVTLEILDYSEYQQRFPQWAAADSAHAAAGFWVLKQNPNGTYYCEKGTCTGSCTLYNFPVRCSCSLGDPWAPRRAAVDRTLRLTAAAGIR